MSMTLEQAKALRHGDVLHHETNKNADGTCQRWRVNGEVKRWKRDQDRIKVPIKHGMYRYNYLTEKNLHLVHSENECPRKGK